MTIKCFLIFAFWGRSLGRSTLVTRQAVKRRSGQEKEEVGRKKRGWEKEGGRRERWVRCGEGERGRGDVERWRGRKRNSGEDEEGEGERGGGTKKAKEEEWEGGKVGMRKRRK